MIDLLSYLLRAELSMLIFLIPFIIWLRKNKSFTFNRMWLMMSLLISALFPLIDFFPDQNVVSPLRVQILPEFSAAMQIGKHEESQTLVSEWLFWLIYLSGCCWSIGKIIFEIISIRRITRNAKAVNTRYFIITSQRFQAFSFFNRIYISEQLNEIDKEKVLAHEMVHVQEKHSFDILIYRLINVLHWYSPLHSFFGKLLHENHEFSADRGAIQNPEITDQYAEVLIRMSTVKSRGLIHTFNSSESIKNRLKMMYNKTNSSKVGFRKLAFVLVPFASAAIMMACSAEEVKVGEAEIQTRSSEVVKDSEASFPGGVEALNTWLQNELVYPEDAKSNGIEGKVMVKFQIAANGKITSAEIVRGADAILDNAALETVRKMPDWIPAVKDGKAVAAEMVLPVVYSLGR